MNQADGDPARERRVFRNAAGDEARGLDEIGAGAQCASMKLPIGSGIIFVVAVDGDDSGIAFLQGVGVSAAQLGA